MQGGKIRIEGFTRFDRPVEIDLDAIGPGVIAVTGPNGAGKTTFMEASGPGILYAEFPYRDPSKIQWWAGAKGGEITRSFRLNGKTYEARIRVPSKGTSPEGYLKEIGTKARPIASGKISDYKDAMARLVGPKAAFLAGEFATQGGAGRFGALGVMDRKALFRYYLDLDRVEACHQRVRDRAKKIDGVAYERLAAEAKEMIEVAVPAAQRAEADATKAVAQWDRAMEAARIRYDEVSALAQIADLIDAYNGALDRVDRADEAVERVLAEEPKAEVDADVASIREQIDEARSEIDRWRQEVARLGQAQTKAEAAAEDVRRSEEARDGLRRLPCGGKGKYSTCPYLVTALREIESLPGAQARLQEYNEQIETIAEADPAARVEAAREAVNGLVTAERMADAIARWSTRLAAAKADAKSARIAALDLRKKLPTPIPEDLPDRETIDALKAKVDEGERSRRAAVDRLAAVKADLAQARSRLKAKIAERDAAAAAAADYPAIQVLIQALGPNGVQALEIDAAGPKISAIANDLLRTCYGTRFTMEIRTLKEYADKRRAGEYQEDFSIRVIDEKAGIENTLDGIGGGERVICDEALRSALALFSRQRSGSQIETLWRDEVFANLYAPNDLLYVQMLRKVREIGNFWQVLYVADTEMARAADAEIHFTEDGEVEIR